MALDLLNMIMKEKETGKISILDVTSGVSLMDKTDMDRYQEIDERTLARSMMATSESNSKLLTEALMCGLLYKEQELVPVYLYTEEGRIVVTSREYLSNQMN